MVQFPALNQGGCILRTPYRTCRSQSGLVFCSVWCWSTPSTSPLDSIQALALVLALAVKELFFSFSPFHGMVWVSEIFNVLREARDIIMVRNSSKWTNICPLTNSGDRIPIQSPYPHRGDLGILFCAPSVIRDSYSYIIYCIICIMHNWDNVFNQGTRLPLICLNHFSPFCVLICFIFLPSSSIFGGFHLAFWMASAIANMVTSTNFTRDTPTPDLGKPQLASHAWLEPIVSFNTECITKHVLISWTGGCRYYGWVVVCESSQRLQQERQWISILRKLRHSGGGRRSSRRRYTTQVRNRIRNQCQDGGLFSLGAPLSQ